MHWVFRCQTQKECHFIRNPFIKGLKTQCTTKSVEMAYYFDPLPNLKPLNLQFRQKIKIFFILNGWSEIEPWSSAEIWTISQAIGGPYMRKHGNFVIIWSFGSKVRTWIFTRDLWNIYGKKVNLIFSFFVAYTPINFNHFWQSPYWPARYVQKKMEVNNFSDYKARKSKLYGKRKKCLM